MSRPDDNPGERAIRRAIEAAQVSPCLSKRGAAVFLGDDVYATACNTQVAPFVCVGSESCKLRCRHTAIHAEQAALLMAGLFANGRDMLHVKVVDGQLVPSGPPSCTQCSKLIVAAGIRFMWLYHETGWRRYTSTDFHRLSVAKVHRTQPEGSDTAMSTPEEA